MTATAAIHPIRDEAAYEATLAEVRRLWGSAGGTPEGDRLEVLTILVEAYEQEHHPIALPDPIEAIKARMGDLGLQREDLCAMLGIGSGRVSELLTRRRHLTLDMIRTLAVELSLPEACLVQRYDLVPAAPKRGRPRVQAGRIGKKAA
ncbi:MAG: HTH-type transcriptional regulator / antitoxin HigA [Acetobacteraceae bacterium]|nr:HTH-type transcriptional regulator / antitoxin HigA [Acetobacteraceae bacterium]